MSNSFLDAKTSSMESTASTGFYLIRFGYQRNIIPIQSGAVELFRGEEVVCRTFRGIEIVEVLAPTEPGYLTDSNAGKFVRRTRPEDQLLWRQLKLLSVEASGECQNFLSESGSEDLLIEVEPLIDGRTLYFHFLGEPSTETESFVQTLSDVYQRKVASSRFAELLQSGCGPGCGTKEKSACGTSSGCAVCAIAGGCTK